MRDIVHASAAEWGDCARGETAATITPTRKSMRFMRWFSHPAGRADAHRIHPDADPTRQGFEAWCPALPSLIRRRRETYSARAETRARLSTRERGGPDDPQARNTLRPD